MSMVESIQDLCVYKSYYDVEPFKTCLNSFEVKHYVFFPSKLSKVRGTCSSHALLTFFNIPEDSCISVSRQQWE